jgi:hypothetical protein
VYVTQGTVNRAIGSIYNGTTNALAYSKTLIQLSQTKTLKITPTCFDHQMINIRELFDLSSSSSSSSQSWPETYASNALQPAD